MDLKSLTATIEASCRNANTFHHNANQLVLSMKSGDAGILAVLVRTCKDMMTNGNELRRQLGRTVVDAAKELDAIKQTRQEMEEERKWVEEEKNKFIKATYELDKETEQLQALCTGQQKMEKEIENLQALRTG